MNDYEKAEKKMKEFKSIFGDNEKWFWIHKNKGEVTLILDNDMTYLKHDLDHDNELDAGVLDESIGNSPGLYALLESININSELC